MALELLKGVEVAGDLPGRFLGGYIYGATANISYSSGPTTVDLNIIGDKTMAFFGGITPNPEVQNQTYNIKLGNQFFRNMFMLSAEMQGSSNEKTVTCKFVDSSIFLDKFFVGLVNRHENGNLHGMTKKVEVDFTLQCHKCNSLDFAPEQKNVRVDRFLQYAGLGGNGSFVQRAGNIFSGGYIILGFEEFVESHCEIPPVHYNFSMLCDAIDNMGCNHNLRNFNRIVQGGNEDIYFQQYTGTLREVLGNWGGDFAFDFTITHGGGLPTIEAIDLTNPPAAAHLTNIKNLTLAGGATMPTVTNFGETKTKEGTYVQRQVVRNMQPPKLTNESKREVNEKPAKVITVKDALGEEAHFGRTDEQYYVSLALAKYSPEARLIYLSNQAATTHWPAFAALGFAPSGIIKNPVEKRAVAQYLLKVSPGPADGAVGAQNVNRDFIFNDPDRYTVFFGIYNKLRMKAVETHDKKVAESFMGQYGMFCEKMPDDVFECKLAGNGARVPGAGLGAGKAYPFYNYKIDYESVPQSQVYNPAPKVAPVAGGANQVGNTNIAGQPAGGAGQAAAIAALKATRNAQRGQKLPFSDIIVQQSRDFKLSVDQGWFNAADIFNIGDENSWGTDQEEVDRTLADPDWAMKMMGVSKPLEGVVPRDPNATNQLGANLDPAMAARKSLASIGALTPGIATLKDHADAGPTVSIITSFVRNFRRMYPGNQPRSESYLPAIVVIPNYKKVFYNALATGLDVNQQAAYAFKIFDVTEEGQWKKNPVVWDRRQQKTQDFNRAELKKDKECETYCEVDIKAKACECPEPPLTIEGLRGRPDFYSYSFRLHHLNQYVDVVFPVGATGPYKNLQKNFASSDPTSRGARNVPAGAAYNAVEDNDKNTPPQQGIHIDNYIGYFVAEYNEKGTTDYIKEIIGTPDPVPGNVMESRVIDLDVTSDIASQEQAGGGFASHHVGIGLAPGGPITTQQISNAYQPLNNLKVDSIQTTFRVTIAGENWMALQNFLTVEKGMTSFTMNISAEGMTQSAEWATRPKVLPKRETIFPKVQHRLKPRGLAQVVPRAAGNNMAAGRQRVGGAAGGAIVQP